MIGKDRQEEITCARCSQCDGEIYNSEEYLSNGDLRFCIKNGDECLTEYFKQNFNLYIAGEDEERRWWEDRG